MYPISEQQIDYILDDIRRRGIHMEDLQLNLLDHICCLAEQHLGAEDDFEAYYQTVITQFYSKELSEIEEETIRLITFKNYFMMKKIMIAAGALSTATFVAGSAFKIMHWPGAAMLLTLAVFLFSFFFLPLLFILKSKEVNTGLDKAVIALGTVLGIVFCLAILFKVQHWPGANIMLAGLMGTAFFVFIPLFFFKGYRKPETRLNTILTTILLIGFTAVSFLSVNLGKVTSHGAGDWASYCRNEMILQQIGDRNKIKEEPAAAAVWQNSEALKTAILSLTATPRPGSNFALPDKLRVDNLGYLGRNGGYDRIGNLLQILQLSVQQYNRQQLSETGRIPAGFALMDISASEFSRMENLYVLNNLAQLQIYVATSMSSEKTAMLRP